MMRLIIIGAGGYGQTIADIAKQSEKYESILFLDDDENLSYTSGKCSDYIKFKDANTEIYPAFGNNTSRLIWVEKLFSEGIAVPTLIHKRAYVSVTATIGNGTIVLPGAIVNTNCYIGQGCIINCGAIIDHDCIIEDGVHICLGAIVKGENRILSCKKVEAGEVVALRTYAI
ncbi:hypothetical protein [Acetobacterium wieringae]|uniref:PglD-related sugar-binding protein n=1 Tax=Acetobacterium wieringae TaxID=52694 RepID=UPI002033CFB3|nr:hypothetical protein [Acetobacterium wieringae]URN84108.1 hypothetical protein CHL1_003282 [Acetobacterium wieringae]